MKSLSCFTKSLITLIAVGCLLLGAIIAKADVVLDWNAIAINTAVANGQNPFALARFTAIEQLAVFEAVNAITGHYHPYLGTITAPRGASAKSAAIAAAYRVAATFFPASLPTLDAARANSLALIQDGQAKDDGIATGEAAAAAMILLRANDGSSPPQFKIPGPPVPGELSNCEWNCRGSLLSMAECNPIRHPECWGLSPPAAAGPHQQPIRERLQRGDDGREPHQHRAVTRSGRRRAFLRPHLTRSSVQSGCPADRRRTGPFDVRERPGFGADKHGHQRQPSGVVS